MILLIIKRFVLVKLLNLQTVVYLLHVDSIWQFSF